MYHDDSFFTLPPWGQFGTGYISFLLTLFILIMTFFTTHRMPLIARLAVAALIFWLFVWLSPQIYYQFYRLIIVDLPAQVVIWPPRHPKEAVDLLLFSGPANLSAHGQGLLGWAMLLVGLFGNTVFRRNAAN